MGLVSLHLMQSLQISGAIPPLHSFWEHDMTLKCLLFMKETEVFYTGLFKMIVGVLTTCHTQYTWDRSICIFLFKRTTLQVFVTYLTGKPDPWRNPIERNHMGLHLENEVATRAASDHHQSHAWSISAVNAGLKILWPMMIRCYSPGHLILQMQPHVISFYGVTSRIRFTCKVCNKNMEYCSIK